MRHKIIFKFLSRLFTKIVKIISKIDYYFFVKAEWEW